MNIPEEEGPPESEPWTVTGWDTRNGTVVLLEVEDPHGAAHVIGVDRRAALAVVDAYEAGDVVLIAPPEGWQILSTFDTHPDEPPLADQPDPDREED